MDQAGIEGWKDIILELFARKLPNPEFDLTGCKAEFLAAKAYVYSRGVVI